VLLGFVPLPHLAQSPAGGVVSGELKNQQELLAALIL
jgi:hypothetical protein